MDPFISYGENKARVFVSSKPLQQSPMFAGKVRAYPSEAPHHIDIYALNINVRLRWKGLPETITLVYWGHM